MAAFNLADALDVDAGLLSHGLLTHPEGGAEPMDVIRQ